MKLIFTRFLFFGLVTTTQITACNHEQTQHKPAKTVPTIEIAKVLHEEISHWDEYIGHLEAGESVRVIPKISGYLQNTHFKEGDVVEKGQLLFTIDKREHLLYVEKLLADLSYAKSQLDLAKIKLKRASELVEKKMISPEEFDERKSEVTMAIARMDKTQADLDMAKLELSYTEIRSPIRGRISKSVITKGNYIQKGLTLLSRIESVDYIYAYFKTDEKSYLRYSNLERMGKRTSSRSANNPVWITLDGSYENSYQGYVDFVDNHLNSNTGTITARAKIINPSFELIPGLYAKIKLYAGKPSQEILIASENISSDLNNRFVYVFDESSSSIKYRQVITGQEINGLTLIKSGLNPNDHIVVNGLQKVRSGMEIKPDFVDMINQDALVLFRDSQLSQRIQTGSVEKFASEGQ